MTNTNNRLCIVDHLTNYVQLVSNGAISKTRNNNDSKITGSIFP